MTTNEQNERADLAERVRQLAERGGLMTFDDLDEVTSRFFELSDYLEQFAIDAMTVSHALAAEVLDPDILDVDREAVGAIAVLIRAIRDGAEDIKGLADRLDLHFYSIDGARRESERRSHAR